MVLKILVRANRLLLIFSPSILEFFYPLVFYIPSLPARSTKLIWEFISFKSLSHIFRLILKIAWDLEELTLRLFEANFLFCSPFLNS